jgi:hypothetical protein
MFYIIYREIFDKVTYGPTGKDGLQTALRANNEAASESSV